VLSPDLDYSQHRKQKRRLVKGSVFLFLASLRGEYSIRRVTMSDNDREKDLFYFNGVNGTTGEYDLAPMTVEQFTKALLRQPLPADKHAAGFYQNFIETPDYGLADDRDPKKIDQAGWGVIFARDEDPAVIEALEPLLKLRREQAGDYYYAYVGSKGKHRGYFPGETKEEFLEGRGTEPFGPADPKYAPYYLLIVGDPEKIPFKFQCQLDIQYAVGRIHFRNPREYAQYAQNVVLAETGGEKLRLPREAAFFGVEHHENDATFLSANHLVKPLAKQLKELSEELKLGWALHLLLKDDATKANLSSLLNGTQTPALLFTASHGVGFNPDDPRQEDHQGALLCQDWQGVGASQKLEDCYYCAKDVESNANLLGLMAFHFACYSGGTPRQNNFLIARDIKAPPQIARKDFAARLPHRLMLNGALAVVGHIERAWGVSIAYTSNSLKHDRHLATYRGTMRRLMDGHPVGSALEYFNEKYGEYSAALSNSVEARELELEDAPDDYELVRLWRANNDARNYIILGDPATRLPVADAREKPTEERPELSRLTVVTSVAQPPALGSGGADPPPEPSEQVAEA